PFGKSAGRFCLAIRASFIEVIFVFVFVKEDDGGFAVGVIHLEAEIVETADAFQIVAAGQQADAGGIVVGDEHDFVLVHALGHVKAVVAIGKAGFAGYVPDVATGGFGDVGDRRQAFLNA